MKKILIITTLNFLLFSCKENNQSPPLIKASTIVPTQEVIEAVPQYILDSIYNNTTSIEGSMYQVGGSFSIGQVNSAKQFVKFISSTSPNELSKNQLGHLMFLNNGNNLMIINVYSNNNQVYGKFDVDGKSYYNLLTGQISDMFTKVKISPKENQ